MPVLRHFQYGNGTGKLYYEFQTGSAPTEGRGGHKFYAVYFWYAQGGLSLLARWENGKLLGIQCESRASTARGVSCADFFSTCPQPQQSGSGSALWKSFCTI